MKKRRVDESGRLQLAILQNARKKNTKPDVEAMPANYDAEEKISEEATLLSEEEEKREFKTDKEEKKYKRQREKKKEREP